MKVRTRAAARVVLGSILGLSLLVMVLQVVRGDQAREVLADARPGAVAGGVVAILAAYLIRARRWQLLLRLRNPEVRYRDCLVVFLIGFAANNVLPLRAGDAMRAFGFRDRLGCGPTFVLTSLLFERLLDLSTLLLMLAGCLWLLPRAISFEGVAFLIPALVITVVMMMALLVAPALLGRIGRRVLSWLPLPERFEERLRGVIGEVETALLRFGRVPVLAAVVPLSLLAWLLEGSVFAFVLSALGIYDLHWVSGWLSGAVATLGTLLPGTPGHVGTFDYFAMASLERIGASSTEGALFGLLAHLIIWLPITTAGGLLVLFGARPAGRQS